MHGFLLPDRKKVSKRRLFMSYFSYCNKVLESESLTGGLQFQFISSQPRQEKFESPLFKIKSVMKWQ